MTKTLEKVLIIILLLIIILYTAYFSLGCQRDTMVEINPVHESNITLFKDPQSNCEYIVTSRGGIYPRLAPSGLQLGCKKDSHNTLNEEVDAFSLKQSYTN